MSPNGCWTSWAVTTSSSQKLCDPIAANRTSAATARMPPTAMASLRGAATARRRLLATCKLGIALVEERLRALGEVVGGGAHRLGGHFLLERLGERGLGGRVDHSLGQPDGDRRAGEQLVAEGLGHGVELVRGRDPVREADPVALLAVEHLAGEDQLLG